MITSGGTATLGLYDLKRQIDAFGGVDYFRPNLAGGYLKNARVMLTNGDIVKSTVDGNTNDPNDPNVSMTGWKFDDNTVESLTSVGAMSDITLDFDASGNVFAVCAETSLMRFYIECYDTHLHGSTNNFLRIY